jgi:beta-lactam-binding protein with PASTA domain
MSASSSNIWEKIKGFFKEIYYFISSRIFLIEFGKVLGVIAGLTFLIFWFMTCFTRHGDSTRVGNYVGKSMKQVLRELDSEDFEYIITDSVYIEDRPADIVLEQNPAPDARVKEGRTIYLKITKAAGDMVILPDIVGRDDVGSYSDIIRSYGFKIGKIDTFPDPNYADGTIKQVLIHGRDVTNLLAQQFKAPQGSLIDFVIYKKERLPEIPSFVSDGRYMTVTEYKAALQMLLEILPENIIVVKDASVTDETEGDAYVIKVSPGAGTDFKKGENVTVFCTQKNPAGVKSDQFDQ